MEDLTREERIYNEFQRLMTLFEEVDGNRKAVIFPLAQNAAFMYVALQDLQKIIEKDGPIESYQNGNNQSGMKQSAALQAYNQLFKSYTGVMKHLSYLVPPEKKSAIVRWRPMTAEEIEEEQRQEEERQRRINEEINRAWERQQRERSS